MKLIPILYSTPMVQALLAGRKTKTRRVMKPQPNNGMQHLTTCTTSIGTLTVFQDEFIKSLDDTTEEQYQQRYKCPYGKPGDVLWVRESFYAWGEWDKAGFTKSGKQKWRFADTGLSWKYEDSRPGNVRNNYYRELGWYKRNSIHMPFTAARIFLKVKSVRVERLHEISDQDAVAEGIEPLNMSATQFIQQGQLYRDYLHKAVPFSWQNGKSAKVSFRSLWNSINGDLAWMQNPWVWVIEFERCEKPALLPTVNRQPSTI